MVKAAIIGCGKIAQVRHIPEYLEHQAVNLVGFYDLNEKRAEELAEKYGGKAYGSVEELLQILRLMQSVSVRPIIPMRN